MKNKKKFRVEKFNYLKIFNIDLQNLRSKNFYNDMISNRDTYYKKYKGFLNFKGNKCHLCKGTRARLFARYKKYILKECLKCGVIYNNLNIESFKNSDFFTNNHTKYEDFKQEMVKTFYYRKNNFGEERYNYIKKKIFPKRKNFNVLDYGCGSGYFISTLKDKKINARGIDIDVNAINFCKSKKLNVDQSELISEPNKKYDLITMFDTIEHFYDPVKELKIAAKKLKPKSYILAFTPNIHSLSFELMGVDHNMLAVFDHICFFNDESLKYLCHRTGLKIKSIEYFGLDIKDYFQSLQAHNGIKLNTLLNKFANYTQSIIDNQKLSNSMRIIFQKK